MIAIILFFKNNYHCYEIEHSEKNPQLKFRKNDQQDIFHLVYDEFTITFYAFYDLIHSFIEILKSPKKIKF